MQAVIGVNASERIKNQNIIVRIVLFTNFDRVARSDNINDTVNYSWVAKEVEKLVIRVQAQTLEWLAVHIAEYLLTHTTTVGRVDVTISKPSAITLAKASQVVVTRYKEQVAHLPPTPITTAAQASATNAPPLPVSSTSAPDNVRSVESTQSPTPDSSASSESENTARVATSTETAMSPPVYPHPPLSFPRRLPRMEPSSVLSPGRHLATVYLSLGSNMGDRVLSLHKAIEALEAMHTPSTHFVVKRVSCLYESPAHAAPPQPPFLNIVVHIETSLSPEDLLFRLQDIERSLGRNNDTHRVRHGPRPIDIDILYYDDIIYHTSVLTIPHPQLYERDFVLRPLLDLAPHKVDPVYKQSLKTIFNKLNDVNAVQVTPIRLVPEKWVLLPVTDTSPVRLMAILNITPDSFSGDGVLASSSSSSTASSATSVKAQYSDVVARAVQKAKTMVETGGVFILDVGGESTRPGAPAVSEQEELQRVVPVIRALRECDWMREVLISVDTTKANVARAALEAGANLLNVIATETFVQDESAAMFDLVRTHQVPIILTHTRGTPATMRELARYPSDVASFLTTVANELRAVVQLAIERHRVRPWFIFVDPGLGFAKLPEHSVTILSHLARWAKLLGPYPVCVGPSRKSFIGRLIKQDDPQRRVFGTAAALAAAVANGAHIVRVHDVSEMWDVVRVANAIWRTF